MKTKTRKVILLLSVTLVTLFILAQLVFVAIESAGGWCSPYLGAPPELGHPAYQLERYGFPLPSVSVVHENCFEARSTTYEWSPVSLGVDLLLLVLLALPIWANSLMNTPTKQEQNPQTTIHE